MWFAMTDCDRGLPRSFGFVLLDFKLVNSAVRRFLPFDPDASQLPITPTVTLRTIARLVDSEKVAIDVAQVAIQMLFLRDATGPQVFVCCSVAFGVLHGIFSTCLV